MNGIQIQLHKLWETFEANSIEAIPIINLTGRNLL